MGPLYMFLENPSLSFPHYPPPSTPLVTVSIFFISMSLVIFCLLVCFVDQVRLIGEIIWYLFFTAWLISLNIMLSRSIHAVVKAGSSFFLSAAYGIPQILIHSFPNRHLGCFQHLAIVNWATMNIVFLHRFFWVGVSVFLWLIPAVDLLGQKTAPFLVFWGNSVLFSTVAALVCIPTIYNSQVLEAT